MYEQIERTVTVLLDSFLSNKFDTKRIHALLAQNPNLLRKLSKEFDAAITLFNRFRDSSFPPYLRNSKELAAVFPHDLPLFTKMELKSKLSEVIGKQLRDDSYFVEIWQIQESRMLLCNLLMLIYRNFILTTFKNDLVDSDGTRKVQISSSIEEMCFQLLIDGYTMTITDSFMLWLKDWKNEGFSEELFNRVRS